MIDRPLSFLDLLNIEEGSSSRETLHHATDLAIRAEALGYRRYWFAEHHNTPGLASGSPELMIAHVANQTSTIHVGAGGVMLPNHAPLQIAEAFHLLESLHPGRIDLGLGRAPGTDPVTTFALRRSEGAMSGDDYPQLLAEMLAYEEGDFPDDHPFRRITVVPADVSLPPVWLLGSSAFSGDLAARIGLRFAFAAHINPSAAVEVMQAYRRSFSPSPYLDAPSSILTVSVVVGETEEHAADLHKIVQVGMAHLLTGRAGRMPTIDQARSYEFTPAERQRLATMAPNAFVGTAKTVAGLVNRFAEACEADEVMITTMLANPADRLRTIEALAPQ
ncbi:MAG: LLM class flavin-dependent oxidoreductase [Thermomicrobiales bacterium]